MNLVNIIDVLRYSLWAEFPAVFVFFVLSALLIAAIQMAHRWQKRAQQLECKYQALL